MATKLTDMCIRKAADNEPIFVLRAQDKLAPIIVRIWAYLAGLNGCTRDKVYEAYDLADEMETWPVRKYPD